MNSSAEFLANLTDRLMAVQAAAREELWASVQGDVSERGRDRRHTIAGVKTDQRLRSAGRFLMRLQKAGWLNPAQRLDLVALFARAAEAGRQGEGEWHPFDAADNPFVQLLNSTWRWIRFQHFFHPTAPRGGKPTNDLETSWPTEPSPQDW